MIQFLIKTMYFYLMKTYKLILLIMLFHNTSFAQKYYLNNLNDSIKNGPSGVFIFDETKQQYYFNLWNFNKDVRYLNNALVKTDLIGNIINFKNEPQQYDTCYRYQNTFKIGENKMLLVGFKRITLLGFHYYIFIRGVDTNLNTLYEKVIPMPDSTKYLYDYCSSIITSKNRLLIVGTRDSIVLYGNRRSFLFELSLNGDSIRYADYSDIYNNGSSSVSVIERHDTAGYIFVNEYDSGTKFYYTDSNLVLQRRGVDKYLPNLMGIYNGDTRKLLSLGDGYFIESKRAFINGKHWHWLMKYRDDMTYLKYAVAPSENDTTLDIGHMAAYILPITYSPNGGIYSLEGTRTDEYGPMNFNENYMQVCRYDTALNLKWSRYLGGDGYNYIPASIFTSENGSCMAICTRRNLDTLAPILQESFIFKLDTTGTLVSVQNISNPDHLSVFMFPNPTFDDVNCWIQNLSSNTAIMNVYNQMGQVVLSTSVSNGKNILNMSHCSPGIYQYSLVTKDGKIQHGKIMKQ